MTITYKVNHPISAQQLANVFEQSGIKRPYDDLKRLQQMINNSSLLISAWDEQALIGVARSMTDFSYCCYLSDLAVISTHQERGVGKKLIDLTREQIGPSCNLVLLSAPNAMSYYPKISFTAASHAFFIPRTN
ncbi:GNAT family N-acetyltransferase [Halalkalibacter urbisdiaboli]|uniref:GNAT family N-acetyltransferase n=1 Tax=Halalkalibacter urbisdiaboli TaxID=1960589 RepID=UPI000B44E9AE|nr:GNAT family N-acetyltransferase [Halalkalibacter urbisdiaboli]